MITSQITIGWGMRPCGICRAYMLPGDCKHLFGVKVAGLIEPPAKAPRKRTPSKTPQTRTEQGMIARRARHQRYMQARRDRGQA